MTDKFDKAATDLIARLEAAEGPSRELDAEIAKAIGWKLAVSAQGWKDGLNQDAVMWHPPDGGNESHPESHPHFTASLGVALTSAPEDPANPGKPMLWSIAYDEDGVGGPRSYTAGLGKGYHSPDYIYGHSDATPAIAFCITSLRARQTDL